MNDTTTPKRVLITFARSFLALELARQFHSQGHTVFVIDSFKMPLTSFSNCVKKSFLAPSPRFDQSGYIKKLQDIVLSEKIDLLIPVYEEIAYISKSLDQFPKSCKVFCPSFEIYEQLQHKWLFQEKLKSLGIPYLKSYLLENIDSLKKHPLKEYALKPCHSRASQFVRKVSPKLPLQPVQIDPFNPWIAQEWTDGQRYCSYAICYEGHINAESVYPVNFAIKGNSCITFEAIKHEKINEWTKNLVKKINFTGQIAFDFIEKPDGSLYAIECNPRATSGIFLFKSQDKLDQAFFKPLQRAIHANKGNSKQIAIGMLMFGWRSSALPNNNVMKFAKTLFTTKDVIFRFKDLKPFIFQPLIFTKLWMKSRELKISMPDCYTHDHDWNGEKEC